MARRSRPLCQLRRRFIRERPYPQRCRRRRPNRPSTALLRRPTAVRIRPTSPPIPRTCCPRKSRSCGTLFLCSMSSWPQPPEPKTGRPGAWAAHTRTRPCYCSWESVQQQLDKLRLIWGDSRDTLWVTQIRTNAVQAQDHLQRYQQRAKETDPSNNPPPPELRRSIERLRELIATRYPERLRHRSAREQEIERTREFVAKYAQRRDVIPACRPELPQRGNGRPALLASRLQLSKRLTVCRPHVGGIFVTLAESPPAIRVPAWRAFPCHFFTHHQVDRLHDKLVNIFCLSIQVVRSNRYRLEQVAEPRLAVAELLQPAGARSARRIPAVCPRRPRRPVPTHSLRCHSFRATSWIAR